jgi:hypothetical protein
LIGNIHVFFGSRAGAFAAAAGDLDAGVADQDLYWGSALPGMRDAASGACWAGRWRRRFMALLSLTAGSNLWFEWVSRSLAGWRGPLS